MNGFFQIAGRLLYMDGDVPYGATEADWKRFATTQGREAERDITIFCVSPKSIDYLVECYPLSAEIRHVYRYGSDVILAKLDFDFYTLLPLVDKGSFSVLTNHIYYTYAVRRQMLQLHCATIEDRGRGILFLGPSGIGKTTQAERWAQCRGSTIINGDIGFVQRTPAGYTAWGTPWHGSSPYCLNASVPVKALVVLKQAPQNALRELTGFEKVREVSGSVFYPTWLEDGMELCTDTLNHLLSDLPVYRLDNRADEDAVRLLAAELDRIS